MIDTTNRQMVGVRGDKIVVTLPRLEMTREEALVHAAWIAALADPTGSDFQATLAAVRST